MILNCDLKKSSITTTGAKSTAKLQITGLTEVGYLTNGANGLSLVERPEKDSSNRQLAVNWLLQML
jgi:hypothetical protein